MAGKWHHPDFLRLGALFVVVSALCVFGEGEQDTKDHPGSFT